MTTPTTSRSSEQQSSCELLPLSQSPGGRGAAVRLAALLWIAAATRLEGMRGAGSEWGAHQRTTRVSCTEQASAIGSESRERAAARSE